MTEPLRVVLRTEMEKPRRSHEKVLRSLLDVKTWRARPPSVSAVRPPRCLGCNAASRPFGKNLVVHGDGTREREVWGPATTVGPPAMATIVVRRYECQLCKACMLVVPREVLPRRRYSGPAIALALALWAMLGMSESAVRSRICPFAIVGEAAFGSWATLRRWATDTTRGRLLATSPSARALPGGTRRQHAERAAAAIVALAPRTGMTVPEAAFAGAIHHGR